MWARFGSQGSIALNWHSRCSGTRYSGTWLYIEARCWVENEDVVGVAPTGDAPTTSEWSTILLPTKLVLYCTVCNKVFYLTTFHLLSHLKINGLVQHCSISSVSNGDIAVFNWAIKMMIIIRTLAHKITTQFTQRFSTYWVMQVVIRKWFELLISELYYFHLWIKYTSFGEWARYFLRGISKGTQNQHFPMQFHVRKVLYCDSNFTENCSTGSNW